MEKTRVMDEFEKICRVPRCSFHNEKIIEYCKNWAEERHFECLHDEKNNFLVIRKCAAPGCEGKDGLVIQGHLDMVAQSDPGVAHDWLNDGIDFYIDGDFYKAHGTTLGADDGVAAAIGFALFEDETLKNPDLELLLTTDEEVGMLSVKNADLTVLNGKNMINIDSGPEGEFTIGCAGGLLLEAVVPVKREAFNGCGYRINIGGLKGGHSGMEITAEKGNAIKILGTVLYKLSKHGKLRVADIFADGKDNAISDHASCELVSGISYEELKNIISETEKDIKNMFRKTDPDIFINFEKADVKTPLAEKESRAVCFLLHNLPYGVMNFDQDLKNVETSSNISPIESDDKEIRISVFIRSSVPERKEEAAERVMDICSMCGVGCVDAGKSYPGWSADYEDPFLKKAMETYRTMYGKEPAVGPTHGGLECGYIMANSDIRSIIAIGPTSFGEHTTAEKLSVSSLNRTYEFVKKVIEQSCE